ncbi:8-oxo-dGTP diphosphatase MutT [Flavobacterium sp. ZT3R18]|uniref:8-oxo-dGTP diphosphatase MutT n=1 Tax=Flavobacterium sp. ZT3R18 TaxID=2594429 RepID=UPI00117A1711|nr:8-oxo-dGTP diphosphatase MutT [Flavobacterium sp. ZT3R18]TRX32751.1 8-oxo-dGTP diphosphatase MutT [Flavobacterium sp. ZT3R18]
MYIPILVTAAIIKKESKILIGKRAPNRHLAGYWEFPGGKMETGETPQECLKREIKEELGIIIKVNDFFMENEHQYDQKMIYLKAFECEYVSGEIVLKDHDQIEWVEVSEFVNFEFAAADIPFINALNGE